MPVMVRPTLGTILILLALGNCRGQASSQCSVEYAAFTSCLDPSACFSCLSTYYEDYLNLNLSIATSYSCYSVDDETCAALSWCPISCDSCEQEFIAYFECETLCSLGCTSSDSPTIEPAYPTPSPTPQLECPEEYGTFNQCMEETGARDDCVTCINAYTPENITTCAYSEQLVCSLSDECPICADCQDEWTLYTNCLNLGTCSAFTCGLTTSEPSPAPVAAVATASPTANPTAYASVVEEVPLACQSLDSALQTCLNRQLTSSQAESCPSCVEDAYQRLVGVGGDTSTSRSALKCSTIQAGLCDATTSSECDCGSCAPMYQALLQCRVQETGSDCILSCDGFNPNPTTSFATTTTVATSFIARMHLIVAPFLYFFLL